MSALKSFDMGSFVPFPWADDSKEFGVKPLEEASEAHGAWQSWDETSRRGDDHDTREARTHLLDECADVVQATCNLLAGVGVSQFEWFRAVNRCCARNELRGRYSDERPCE